jgi:hypothetical protein
LDYQQLHGLRFGVRLSDDCHRSVAVWAKGIVVSENGLQMNRINDCCRSVADASINHGAADLALAVSTAS